MRRNTILSIALASLLISCGGSERIDQDDGKKQVAIKSEVKIFAEDKVADFKDIGLISVNATNHKTLNYDEEVQKVFVQDFESFDAKDNYIWDMKYKNGKLAVASVYNNALVIFDDNGNKKLSKIANIKGASHGTGVDAIGTEGIKADGSTGASENYFKEVKFDKSGENVYMMIRSKFLGTTPEKQKYSDVNSRGIYKAKIQADNSIAQSQTKRVDLSFSHFDILNNGDIIGLDTNTHTFHILDENLTQKSNFKVPHAYLFSAKNDRLFVYVKDTEEQFIQEYGLDGHAIGSKVAYPYAMDIYSFFELSLDAKKLFVLKDDTKNNAISEICSYNTTATFHSDTMPQCTNLNANIVWSFVAFSPNGKQMALTKGFSNLTSIVDIQNDKPELVGQIDYEHDEHWFGITYMGDNKLAYSSDNRKIQVYDLEQGMAISKDTKFNWAKTRAIADISKDINNIVVTQNIKHGKKSIKAHLQLPTFLHGVNIAWTLSPEFNGYINDKGKAVKIPEKKISGKITAKFKMLNEDKTIYKEENITKDISIMPKI